MQILKKWNLEIKLFLGLIFVGVVIRYLFGNKSVLWDFWSVVDTSSAVAMALLAFLAYKDILKGDDEIAIYFVVNGKRKDTKLSLLRKDCTRGEILGVLGIIQANTENRFKLEKATSLKILDEVQAVQRADKNIFEICLNQEEFDYFDIEEDKR